MSEQGEWVVYEGAWICRPNAMGYTCDEEDAWVLTEEEAKKFIASQEKPLKMRRKQYSPNEERIAALTRELEAARSERDAALESKMHTQQWYAERWEPLKAWARKDLPENLKDQFFCILANTVKSVCGARPPSLTVQLNLMRHDRDAAHAEVAKLREEVKAAFLRGARLQGADEADAERSWQKYGERDLPDRGESVDKLVRSTYHEAPPCPELTPDQETEIDRRAEIEDKDGPSTYSGISEWYGHR